MDNKTRQLTREMLGMLHRQGYWIEAAGLTGKISSQRVVDAVRDCVSAAGVALDALDEAQSALRAEQARANALAAAIELHQMQTRSHGDPERGADQALYATLQQNVAPK